MEILDHIDRAAIERLLAAGEFFWLDLAAPSTADLNLLGPMLRLHDLALEDTHDFDQRPKLEPYGDHALLVMHAAALDTDGRAPLAEIHLHISGDWLVTVTRERSAALDGAHRRIAAGVASEAAVVHRVVDAIADTYATALEPLEQEVDALEDALLASPRPEHRRRILDLRRATLAMQQHVSGAADALDPEALSALPGLTIDQSARFRDVRDHLLRANARVEALRDRLDGALHLHLAVLTTRLTVVATIFLPLSVVTGFFGMNFGWLVHHIRSLEAFLAFGVGGMTASAIALVLWLRRTGGL